MAINSRNYNVLLRDMNAMDADAGTHDDSTVGTLIECTHSCLLFDGNLEEKRKENRLQKINF